MSCDSVMVTRATAWRAATRTMTGQNGGYPVGLFSVLNPGRSPLILWVLSPEHTGSQPVSAVYLKIFYLLTLKKKINLYHKLKFFNLALNI